MNTPTAYSFFEPSPHHEPRNPMWPPHPVPLPRGGEGVVLVGEGPVLGCNAQILLGNFLPEEKAGVRSSASTVKLMTTNSLLFENKIRV
jgi:hypothetical protein